MTDQHAESGVVFPSFYWDEDGVPRHVGCDGDMFFFRCDDGLEAGHCHGCTLTGIGWKEGRTDG